MSNWQLDEMGIAVRVEGGDLLLEPGSRVPLKLISALRENKREVIEYISGSESQGNQTCRVLDEWRRQSIPVWRKKMQQATENHETKGKSYALWMLKEILFDPEYREELP